MVSEMHGDCTWGNAVGWKGSGCRMILPVWWRVLLGGIKGVILRREAHIAAYFI